MKHTKLALAAAVAIFSLVGTQSAIAQSSDPVITGLLNMPFSDIDGKDANVVLFEVGPGWTIANHFHPVHIFLYVIEGSVIVEAEGREAQVLTAGDAVYEAPNVNMVASNTSSTEGAKFVVFTVGNIGDPVTVYVD